MGMYEPPIGIIYQQAMMQMENDIYRVVLNHDINVDKEELIRALKYDRGQYKKGHADAMDSIVRCKDCKHLQYGYQCYNPLGMNLSNNEDAYVLVNPDDFCSYGERRSNERKAD